MLPTYSVSMEVVGTNVEANLANAQLWKEKLPAVLEQIGNVAVKEIQDRINAVQWNESQGQMFRAVTKRVDIMDFSVTVFADARIAPHTIHHERGVKPQPMSWLVGKTIPFTIINGKFTFAGRGSKGYLGPETQFRRVTEQALARGAWFHPGLEARYFYRDGMLATVRQVQERLKSFVFKVAMEGS